MCYLKYVLILVFSSRLLPSYALTVGTKAPEFTLTDTRGEQISLSDFRGKYVVLEWFNPDCPASKRHYRRGTMTTLAHYYQGEYVIWMAINSTHYMRPEDNRSWQSVHQLDYYILNDFSGEVGQRYHAQTTPHMYIINPKGTLVYSGAIDDDPKGEKLQPLNYVQAALETLLEDEPVSHPQTQPYGCLVKYKP